MAINGKAKMNLKSRSRFVVTLFLLIGVLPVPLSAYAAADTSAPAVGDHIENEGDKRVIGTPNFVVFLKDDGSLEYYQVIESVGHQIGVTPPGWRFDNRGRELIHRVVRADGAKVELWHVFADIYYVEAVGAGGALIGAGEFSAQGAPGGCCFVDLVSSPDSSTATTSTATATTTSSSSTTASGTVYIVERGDTLYRISLRYGVSLVALMQANGITNADLIYAGQHLNIP